MFPSNVDFINEYCHLHYKKQSVIGNCYQGAENELHNKWSYPYKSCGRLKEESTVL